MGMRDAAKAFVLEIDAQLQLASDSAAPDELKVEVFDFIQTKCRNLSALHRKRTTLQTLDDINTAIQTQLDNEFTGDEGDPAPLP